MKLVAVAIIRDPDKKYLLVASNRDFGKFTGYYYPPGGHIEEESVPDGLKRELREELSLEILPIRQLAETPGDVEGQITVWWECEVVSGELRINNAELADARYCSREEMGHMPIWPATRKFFEEYLDRPTIQRESEA
jgi:8-oxo-dGTP pyrophosphatase MutT (NUDIX family)